MFGWLKKDPVKDLKKKYDKKFEEAFFAQRNGNIALYAELSKECSEIQKEIDKIAEEKKGER